MNFFEPIDQYCERLSPGLESEPLNLISNVSFFAAGWLLVRQAKGNHRSTQFYRVLGWQTIAVGVGSSLFHSLANFWSKWADILPIMCLVFSILYFFFRNAVRLTRSIASLALAGFGILSVLIAMVSDRASVNGSELYFGTWVSLLGMSSFYAGRELRSSLKYTALALVVFTASLCFRTFDDKLCSHFKHGTHFLWHICNAIVILLVVQALPSPSKNERT